MQIGDHRSRSRQSFHRLAFLERMTADKPFASSGLNFIHEYTCRKIDDKRVHGLGLNGAASFGRSSASVADTNKETPIADKPPCRLPVLAFIAPIV